MYSPGPRARWYKSMASSIKACRGPWTSFISGYFSKPPGLKDGNGTWCVCNAVFRAAMFSPIAAANSARLVEDIFAVMNQCDYILASSLKCSPSPHEDSVQSMDPFYSPQDHLYQPRISLTDLRRTSIAPAIADTQHLPVLA